jgi:hypothetical protein
LGSKTDAGLALRIYTGVLARKDNNYGLHFPHPAEDTNTQVAAEDSEDSA